MPDLLDPLLKQLKSLEKTTIEIRAEGNYPLKTARRSRRGGLGTRVQEVAFYQNDGTETIKAAHFVEKAAKAKRGWATPIFQAVSKYLEGFEGPLIDDVGETISRDIGAFTWRIDTGTLRESYKPIVYRQ
jgi:hypothetical protein